MNQGTIAARYAKALLKYVLETGNGDIVYSQACLLWDKMQHVPKLDNCLSRYSDITIDQKIDLVSAALEEPLSVELEKFIRLVNDYGRTDFLQRMLHSFIGQYRQEKGMKFGRLVSSVPLEGLKTRIEGLLCEKTGADVRLEEEVQPSLIGGFILEVDDLRLDASVRSQLRRLRRELIDDSARIV